MAIDNLPNASDESRLSGAYIRSLVKQLTTSTPLNTNQNSNKNNATNTIVSDLNQAVTTNNGQKLGMAKPNNHPQGHKKQVRRRLHTSRPYQERLLNMAEARKEIVTALKFHRAAMKQANEQRQKQQQRQLEGQLVPQQSIFETIKIKHEIQNNIEVDNFMSNPSSLHNNSNYNNNFWGFSSSSSFNETLNIPLPNQTLGLNLNFQAFTNLDTNFCHSNNNISPNHSFSSSMSPSSSSSSLSTPRWVDRISKTTTTDVSHGMHPTLDEEEIAKMRSIGEQHQIEWDDTLDLMKSAWWFKYLKSVDFDKEIKREEEIYSNNNEELMEFPAWLSANNDQCFLQQHLHDSCSDDTTLPW